MYSFQEDLFLIQIKNQGMNLDFWLYKQIDVTWKAHVSQLSMLSSIQFWGPTDESTDSLRRLPEITGKR